MRGDKRQLKSKHRKTILRREILNILGVIGIKEFLRKKVETNTPVFNQEIDIDELLPSIFVLPNMPWSYRWQRPQQIFSRLAKKGYNIFYISPVTSNTEYISEISKNIYEVHLKSNTPGNALRDFHLNKQNVEEMRRSFERLLGKYIKEESYLFTLHPVWHELTSSLSAMKKIYDLMDLYSGFPEAREDLVQGEEELIKNSDIVLTTAENLFEYAKKLNSNVHMVRNGSDFEKFSNLKESGVLDGLKDRPIVGYFGAISDWVDFDLLEYIVKENMDKYFVFLGSLNTSKVRKLYGYANVYFLGEVSHDELPGYLAYFDVCTIPFILNDLIKSTNPVKFYEYIASGKPVVSVDLPELKQYVDICYLSKNREEFSKDIFKALYDEDMDIVEKRKVVARENSWEERVGELVKIMG